MKPGFQTYVVYVLICPSKGDIRYVGSTSAPETRKAHHQKIKANPTLAVDRWTNALVALGMPPKFRVVATVNAGGFKRNGSTILPGKTAGAELERLTIGALTAQGCYLLNVYGREREPVIERAELWDEIEDQMGLLDQSQLPANDPPTPQGEN